MSRRPLNDAFTLPLIWGPWSGGDAIITRAGIPLEYHWNTTGIPLEYELNFNSRSNLPSSYQVEVRYFNGAEFVTKTAVIAGSGITVTVY